MNIEIWVLTSEYNDYDQHGEYFVDAWLGKPTREQLRKTLEVPESEYGEKFLDHIENGGGREKHEDVWYYFRKHE